MEQKGKNIKKVNNREWYSIIQRRKEFHEGLRG